VFGRTKTTTEGQTYLFRMIMSFSSDPSNIVHDIHGDFTLEPGESIRDAQDKIIDEYLDREPHLRGDHVHILQWTYS
jgi:hypothetical protein